MVVSDRRLYALRKRDVGPPCNLRHSLRPRKLPCEGRRLGSKCAFLLSAFPAPGQVQFSLQGTAMLQIEVYIALENLTPHLFEERKVAGTRATERSAPMSATQAIALNGLR